METKHAGSEWPTDIKIPSEMPEDAQHVATVDWAWSPGHSRVDSYYLSMDDGKSNWVLWLSYFDDGTAALQNSPYAYGPKTDLPVIEVARKLLQQGWIGEVEQNKDPEQFHSVSSEGILKSADLKEIANNVWGE